MRFAPLSLRFARLSVHFALLRLVSGAAHVHLCVVRSKTDDIFHIKPPRGGYNTKPCDSDFSQTRCAPQSFC